VASAIDTIADLELRWVPLIVPDAAHSPISIVHLMDETESRFPSHGQDGRIGSDLLLLIF
jgi:hypothetical protein